MCGIRTIVSTAIPEDAAITNYISFMDLRDGAEHWGNEVLRPIDKEHKEIFAKDKFDISSQADKLAQYYEAIILQEK